MDESGGSRRAGHLLLFVGLWDFACICICMCYVFLRDGVIPQFGRGELNRIVILFLVSYSLEYSSGRIAKADLNPPGGLRRRYDGFHT